MVQLNRELNQEEPSLRQHVRGQFKNLRHLCKPVCKPKRAELEKQVK